MVEQERSRVWVTFKPDTIHIGGFPFGPICTGVNRRYRANRTSNSMENDRIHGSVEVEVIVDSNLTIFGHKWSQSDEARIRPPEQVSDEATPVIGDFQPVLAMPLTGGELSRL